MDKTKPISITDAKPSEPIFLSRLMRAETSAAWYKLLLDKKTAEDATRAFQRSKDRWEKQLKAAQHSVNCDFRDWDTETGQVFTPVNAPQRRETKTGDQP